MGGGKIVVQAFRGVGDKILVHILLRALLKHLENTLTGFAKTFCPSLIILSDEAGVLRQTFLVFVSHFT